MPFIKENREKMSELYTRMANQTAAELADGWTNFCIGYIVDEKGQETQLVFASYDEGKTWKDYMAEAFCSDRIMKGIFDCKETCQELREVCAAVGDKWTAFTLLIDAKGGFSAKFDYDPMPDFSSTQREMWIGEYLC